MLPAQTRLFTPLVVDVTAGISSAVAGALTFWEKTDSLSYKNVSSQGMWDAIKPPRKMRGQEILRRAQSGEITARQAHFELKDAIVKGDQLADETLRVLGSEGIMKQFSLLRTHQKINVALSTLAVTGIALGSILFISRGLFTEQEKQYGNGEKQR